jgi:ABC-type Fe3+ transport system permease subunit
MPTAIALLLVVGLVLTFRTGVRHQAYRQSAADHRDQRTKLRKARMARLRRGHGAVVAWALVAGLAALMVMLASAGH